MRMKTAQILMECLLEQGVDTVFGYPGGTILNVYDEFELHGYKDKIRHILTAHEQGAAHAADGYALSSAGAVMGTLLGIKPLVHIEEGKVVSLAKARGQKAGYQMILERVREEGVDQDYPVYFGHSNAPAMMEELAELIRSACALPQTYESAIGPVVGTHAGPGCAGFAYA